MNILPGFKLCRKGLHQYPAVKKRCPECHTTSRNRWRAKNIERDRELKRRWQKQNFKKKQEHEKHWREQNPERNRELKRRWYKQNISQEQERNRRWREKNPDKIRSKVMRRIAKKKQATPPWADHAAIDAIYAESVRLEQETGIAHHVDHIYPLTSPFLCGLHIAENLQVLSAAENQSKSNRIWPGQLDVQKLPIKRLFTPEQIALTQEQKDLT